MKTVYGSVLPGCTCVFVSRVVMSAVATRHPTVTRDIILTRLSIPSFDHSNRVKTGAGATWTRRLSDVIDVTPILRKVLLLFVVAILAFADTHVSATTIERDPTKRKGAGAPFQIRRGKLWG